MKEQLIRAIADMVETEGTIDVTIETTDFNGIQMVVSPRGVEEGDGTIIVYLPSGVLTIDTNEIGYDESENKFVCIGTASVITLSFE